MDSMHSTHTPASSGLYPRDFLPAQGTSIEATFWRDAADAAYDLLEEGKVGARVCVGGCGVGGWGRERLMQWDSCARR